MLFVLIIFDYISEDNIKNTILDLKKNENLLMMNKFDYIYKVIKIIYFEAWGYCIILIIILIIFIQIIQKKFQRKNMIY